MKLTFPQRRALGGLMNLAVQGKTAKQLYVRSDVLWRLEEQGLVARSFTDLWRITPAGEAAYRATMSPPDPHEHAYGPWEVDRGGYRRSCECGAFEHQVEVPVG